MNVTKKWPTPFCQPVREISLSVLVELMRYNVYPLSRNFNGTTACHIHTETDNLHHQYHHRRFADTKCGPPPATFEFKDGKNKDSQCDKCASECFVGALVVCISFFVVTDSINNNLPCTFVTR